MPQNFLCKWGQMLHTSAGKTFCTSIISINTVCMDLFVRTQIQIFLKYQNWWHKNREALDLMFLSKSSKLKDNAPCFRNILILGCYGIQLFIFISNCIFQTWFKTSGRTLNYHSSTGHAILNHHKNNYVTHKETLKAKRFQHDTYVILLPETVLCWNTLEIIYDTICQHLYLEL